MNYKMFLPTGAYSSGNTVALENGLTFPSYAFIAVPIVGLKGSSSSDVLSSGSTTPVYYDTKTNSFTLSKKVRNLDSPVNKNGIGSLSTSDATALIKFNFDGYINVSQLITNVKAAVSSIQSTEKNLVAYEQDVGYASVRVSNLIDYTIVTINPTDDYASIDYPLSQNLTLRDLLVYQLKSQTLNPQGGVSTKILVKNLKNLAVNVYEPVLAYLLDGVKTNLQIDSAFVENIYYVPDEEFYIGEAIQFSFPGFTPSSVYLLAKDMLNSLYFNQLYLDYFLDGTVKITVVLDGSNQNYVFGTRFENYLIHPSRLVNIDKSFDPNADTGTVQTDGSLNVSVAFNPVKVSRDQNLLQNFIKDAIDKDYVQSQENAIKFAFVANLTISNIVTSVLPPSINDDVVIDAYYGPVDLSTDYDPVVNTATSSTSSDINSTIATLLPSLIKCPTISNGSVNGSPNQSIFPMMSNLGYKTITDLSMVNNPTNNSGEYSVPQTVRFNNPFLVDVIEGVTNKIEDGFLGQVGGKAVYQNRLGGLIAGIRHMQSTNPTGKTLFSATSAVVPAALLSKLVANLTKAFFDVFDPTGMMLQCAQVDMENGNVNDQIVMIAMTMAAFTGEKKSPVSYEEIAIALAHVKGDTTQFNKTVDGSAVGTVRTPNTEQTTASTKIDNTANSTPMMIANTLVNGVKAVILDGLGADVETKTQRLKDQPTTYDKYDSGSDHSDRLYEVGSYLVAGLAGTKDKIF